jgi:hypothetical protein
MHEAHWKAAEMHKLAAQAHRTAAEHNEKGDSPRQSGIRRERGIIRITLTR